MDGGYVKSVEEALNFAQKIGFPDHGIIIKKSKYSKYGINKNIITEEDIVLTVTKMLKGIFTKRIYIETDMRAHKNPTRMRAIEQATINLINNIQSLCPKCQNPGFVAVDTKKGLKCSACLLPTSLPIYEIHKCSSCNYEDKKNTTYGDSADPMYCDYCNP